MNEDFSERGMRYAKDQFDVVLKETEQYVREKPAQSLLYALLAGIVLNRMGIGRILGGVFRVVLFALKPAILIYGATKLYRAVEEENRGIVKSR
jgi:hypothetical protein